MNKKFFQTLISFDGFTVYVDYGESMCSVNTILTPPMSFHFKFRWVNWGIKRFRPNFVREYLGLLIRDTYD